MRVWISKPEPEFGLPRELTFDLRAEFGKAGFAYGNGYYVSISATERGSLFSEVLYDIRYDRSFNPNKADEWLRRWAEQYWSGKDGAYQMDKIEITVCEEAEE